MKYTVYLVHLLGIFAVIAFAAWALWNANHHVWSVIVAVIGVGLIQWKES
jgi:hypothetical protein